MSRFGWLRLRYPGDRRSWLARPAALYAREAEYPCYDAELSMELLGRTGELPNSKRDLVALLAEYRRALHALASRIAKS
jgi:hypothetical protein